MNKYYKIGLVAGLLLTQSVYADTISLKNGLNLIGNCQSQAITKTDFITKVGSSYVNTISAVNNGKKSDGSTGFAITFPNVLNVGQGYLVEVNSDVDIDLTCATYSAYTNYSIGINLLTVPSSVNTKDALTSRLANAGITLSNVISAVNNGKKSDGSTGFSITFPTNITSGQAYLIDIASIDYSLFLQNGLTADPGLTSYTTTNLNNKSVLVMENNSGALKTSLITFSSDQTYKEVEVSNFSASTLNGSDADINATVSSAVSSLTTGVCGNWNFDGTDLNMTPSDGTTTGTTVQISDSSDGNFTIGSTYKKVVYYGAAIDLSNVTDCQLDSFLLPPSVPN